MAPATLTLKVSGSLLDEQGTARLARALARLPAGTDVALVHGGGPQIDEALAKLDEPVRHREGLRVTSRAQANVVQAVLDRVGTRLAEDLAQAGLATRHVDSFQRRFVAKPKRPDLGRVGTPVRTDADGLLAGEAIPVVTPVGTDGTGPLNVNADEAAAALAAELASEALVFATATPGVLDARGRPIAHLEAHRASELIAEGTAAGGMQPKLEAGLAALDAGVPHVHVAPLAPDLLARVVGEGPTPGTRLSARQEAPA